jgi:hypothetical protein
MGKYDFIPAFGTSEYDSAIKEASHHPNDFDFFHDHLPFELGDVRNLAVENLLSDPAWYYEENIPRLLVDYLRTNDSIWLVSKYILNIDLPPYQLAVLRKFWDRPFCLFVASRGASKSFLLAVYSVLRLLLHQGCKICVVGASLRQSLVIFNYIMQIWNKAPVLRDIVGDSPKRDINMSYWQVGLSRIVFLPLGDGETIRGQRANIIIADEFASINPVVFENVVRGFAAVKSDGVWSNIQQAYSKKMLQTSDSSKGENAKALEEISSIPNLIENNQIIIAGSAVPEFNHFYKYYSYYKDIIETKGSAKLLKEIHPDRDITDDVNYKDYCIIHLPYDALPPGLMDDGVLKQGKATMDPSIFMMEYGACFVKDTNGFIPASTIHKSTCPIKITDEIVDFKVSLIGEKDDVHFMGIDPASEDDNFTVSIVAVRGPRRGIVYQWATNRKDFEQLKREKVLNDDINDYLTYCILHIRNLIRRFNPFLIGLDSGGGGLAIKEALKDKTKFIDENDVFILDMEDETSAELPGNPILKMIEFSDYGWRREAHWGIKSDISGSSLLFPSYDHAEGLVAQFEAIGMGKYYDTMEDAFYEIEQCKQECVRIRVEQTPNGLEKWDVPNVQTVSSDGKKVKLKKDRFTSLMIANWLARTTFADQQRSNAVINHPMLGGRMGMLSKQEYDPNMPRYGGRGASRMYNLQNNGRYLQSKCIFKR